MFYAYEPLLTTNGVTPQPYAAVQFFAADDATYRYPLQVFGMDGQPLKEAFAPRADIRGYINNAGGFKLEVTEAVAKSPGLPAKPIYSVRSIIADARAARADARAARADARAARAEAAEGAALELAMRIAAGEFKGEDGAPGAQGVPGVNAIPAAEAMATAAQTPGNPLNTALSATYAGAAKDVAAGDEKHAQLGPGTRTLNGGQPGVLAFINNAPAASDSGTRIYIMPRAKPTTGVGGVLKLFADPFFDAGDYRDLGMYFHANQNTDLGTHGTGVWWINSKVGTNLGASGGGGYAGKNPDIAFSFQDGAAVGGRFSQLGPTQAVFIVGAGKAATATRIPTVRLEVRGDFAFSGGARAIRWDSVADTTTDNAMHLAVDNWRLELQAKRALTIRQTGSIIMGDIATNLTTAATDGFFYMKVMTGTPTGTPTTWTGSIPLVVDASGSKLWAYIAGAWKSVHFA